MAYQVLARKYRPQLFSDVIGQDHVTRTLLNALSQGRIAHGYIFSGHRGIGKTTIARILAAALNCSTAVGTPERPTDEPCRVCINCREISSASRQETSIFEESHSFDVEEIDAATNRGIDDARLLTTKIQTRPTNKSKYRIIILDEAHQITDAAWNALLKTLEEPPEWAVFLFATTQPEDIPQTIRSRCQHFSFHAVKLDDIVGQLRFISTREQIVVDDATLTLLAEAGDGSMRDALSIMDQAIASAPLVDGHPRLEITQVRELMGSVSNTVYEQILDAVHANNSADVLAITGRLLDAGNGAPQLARQFVRYLRNTIVAKVTKLKPGTAATGIAADLLQISPEERTRAARSATLFTEEELSRFLSIMLRTFDELGYRQEQRFHLELGLLKLVHVQRLVPIEELLSQLGTRPSNTFKTVTSQLTASQASTAQPRLPSAQPNPVVLSEAPEQAKRIEEAQAKDSEAAKAAPTVNPFSPPNAIAPSDTDRNHKTPVAFATSTHDIAQPTTIGSMALAPASAPQTARPAPTNAERPHLVPTTATASAPNPAVIATLQGSETDLPDSALEPEAVTAEPTNDHDAAALQTAIVHALAAVKGQSSASEQMEDAVFHLVGNTLTVQTTLSKAMLPVLINAEADRILKATLRQQNAGTLKFEILPGAPVSADAPKKSNRPAASGSAAELAERHPMVQQAKRIFSAEISNVIDLRAKTSSKGI
jgi:DNA polymerase-3 subunit gamma/tau